MELTLTEKAAGEIKSIIEQQELDPTLLAINVASVAAGIYVMDCGTRDWSEAITALNFVLFYRTS